MVVTSAQGPHVLRRRQHPDAGRAPPHSWKVNFCKFTNETRNGIEDASAHSGPALDRRGQRHRGRRRLRAGAGLRRDPAGRRQLLGGLAARGAAARRAARHRRPDPRRRQARRPRATSPTSSPPPSEGIRGERAVQWRLVDGDRQGPRVPGRDRPARGRGRRDVVPPRRRRAGRAAHPAAARGRRRHHPLRARARGPRPRRGHRRRSPCSARPRVPGERRGAARAGRPAPGCWP